MPSARIKLKRCPFCGGVPSVVSLHPTTTQFPHTVECSQCGARSQSTKLASSCKWLWNQRKEPQPKEPPRGGGRFPFPRD